MISIFTNELKWTTFYNNYIFVIAGCLAKISTTLNMTDPKPGHPNIHARDATNVMYTKHRNCMRVTKPYKLTRQAITDLYWGMWYELMYVICL